jgi:ABC-type transporter Mla maintaining outer membrane lipid asymmetry permease subunit MlaE
MRLREEDTIPAQLGGGVMSVMKAMVVVVGLFLAATPGSAMTGQSGDRKCHVQMSAPIRANGFS